MSKAIQVFKQRSILALGGLGGLVSYPARLINPDIIEILHGNVPWVDGIHNVEAYFEYE